MRNWQFTSGKIVLTSKGVFMSGFLKVMRNEIGLNLAIHEPDAFKLLFIIAYRARRTPCKITGLDIGEAFIGDYLKCGLTERRYRTSKDKLAKLNFATFRTTNKGTIAKIINTDIYDINYDEIDEQRDEQETSKRRLTRILRMKE